MTRPPAILVVLLALASSAGAQSAPAGTASAQAQAAMAHLVALLDDSGQSDDALMGLRATGDKDVLPVFAALTASHDVERRFFAVHSLAQVCGTSAAVRLLAVARTDESLNVRRAALAALLDLQTLSAGELEHMLDDPDPSIRCMAASGMVVLGHAKDARQAVAPLADAKDPRVAAMARAALFGAGDAQQAKPLQDALADPLTGDDLVALLVRIVAKSPEIQPAQSVPLIQAIAHSSRPAPMRAQAYAAWIKIQPQAQAQALEALKASDQTVFRVRLLAAIADADGARESLEALARQTDSVGPLARLELARLAARGPASQPQSMPASAASSPAEGGFRAAVADSLAMEHPIVVGYVVERTAQDLYGGSPGAEPPTDAARRLAAPYAGPLMMLVDQSNPDADRMGREHMLAADAVAMLVDMRQQAIQQHLTEILKGPYNARQRVVGAALLRTRDVAATLPLAAIAVESPHEEIRIDGLLAMARVAEDKDGAIRTRLAALLANPGRFTAPLTTQAAWHLLRLEGQSAQAATILARHVK